MKPADIEQLSFQIIEREAGAHGFSRDQWTIVRRMIHTSADFDYIQNVRFHAQAVSRGVAAIAAGKAIFTDTRMAQAGISPWRLKPFGTAVHCLIGDPAVAEKARLNNHTRAAAAVEAAARRMAGGIYVIGNAPTALLKLIELIQSQQARPALVVGLPVGFVNAAESKAALLASGIVSITNVGRKGGSNVAASVVNALAQLALEARSTQSGDSL